MQRVRLEIGTRPNNTGKLRFSWLVSIRVDLAETVYNYVSVGGFAFYRNTLFGGGSIKISIN